MDVTDNAFATYSCLHPQPNAIRCSHATPTGSSALCPPLPGFICRHPPHPPVAEERQAGGDLLQPWSCRSPRLNHFRSSASRRGGPPPRCSTSASALGEGAAGGGGARKELTGVHPLVEVLPRATLVPTSGDDGFLNGGVVGGAAWCDRANA